MRGTLWIVCMSLCGVAGCAVASALNPPAADVLACEAALVTLLDAPQPAPVPDAPDLGDAAGELYGGPLDTLRDAKELIRKGNDLADRGKALLDAAQRDGKITVDVQLPKPFPVAGTSAPQLCIGGICPVVPPRPEVPAPPPQATATVQGDACPGGVCRPRLLWRFRR